MAYMLGTGLGSSGQLLNSELRNDFIALDVGSISLPVVKYCQRFIK